MATYRCWIGAGLVLILTLGNSSHQNLIEPNANRVSFAVKIGILPTGDLTQYALAHYRNNILVSLQDISRDQLLKIGTGEWPIPRTYIFKNFFDEYGLKNDTLPDGSIREFSAALDSLWKIRFEAHPFNHQLGSGWSQGEIRPSLKQQAYIYERYGVRGYDQDYFVDSSFFKLWKDVLDEAWITTYRSLY